MDSMYIDLELRVGSLETGFSDFRAYCNRNFSYIHESLDELRISIQRIERNMVTRDVLRAELSGFVTKEDLRAELSGFVTKEDLRIELSRFVTKEYLDKKLANFVTKEYLDEKLANFVTKDEFNELRAEVSAMSHLLLRIAKKIGVE